MNCVLCMSGWQARAFSSGMEHLSESIVATLPPFVSIEGQKWFFPISANKSLRSIGLHLSLSAKSSFYLPAFEISRSCRTGSGALTFCKFHPRHACMLISCGMGPRSSKGICFLAMIWLSSHAVNYLGHHGAHTRVVCLLPILW
jgi:hypothetical protein